MLMVFFLRKKVRFLSSICASRREARDSAVTLRTILHTCLYERRLYLNTLQLTIENLGRNLPACRRKDLQSESARTALDRG
jgi:hypothetical protein